MSEVRIGIVGCGGMGSHHGRSIRDGKVPGAVLTAICDTAPEARERGRTQFGESIGAFSRLDDLIEAGAADAVVIATPHYDHPPLAIRALQGGLHVMSEKPAGVYTRQVREMNEAAARSDRIFGLMLQQRLTPVHRRLKDLLDAGELGDLKRNSWVVTDWYRPQSYYDSGGWRATWSGEGGGVLVNQCPHQLDLWQWFCGMPRRVRAFCGFGRYHRIEVEDDVTAYVEYEGGATGTFITTTGEAPGTNRFEIAGDRGRIVLENGALVFDRNRTLERRFNETFKGGFGTPECWRCEIPARGQDPAHAGVLAQWVKAIQASDPSLLTAPGSEGIRGVELANAMLLSAWTDAWVELPIDEDVFYDALQERITRSRVVKPVEGKVMNVEGTF